MIIMHSIHSIPVSTFLMTYIQFHVNQVKRQNHVTYDAEKGRVVYQPVSIEERTLVPRVVRDDHRYEPALKEETGNG